MLSLTPKQYGIVHTPLMGVVRHNLRREGERVIFVGHQLCFFERNSAIPDVGREVEVMITRPLHRRYPEGHQFAGGWNHDSLLAVNVMVVEPAHHMLVAIDGFACSGSMCATTAHGLETQGRKAFSHADLYPEMRNTSLRRRPGVPPLMAPVPQTFIVTPGKVGMKEADQISVRSGDPYEPRIPTNVYVSRNPADLGPSGKPRVLGATRFEDVVWGDLVRV